MDEDKKQVKEREYTAFISYRHLPLDQKAAELIQKKIERYNVPKEYRGITGGSRLGAVFRDEDELPASSSLTGSITYALDHSKFLIVICTPDLPLSKWCETEIRYFTEKHGRDHVLAVLADGEPDKSFSPYLRFEYDEHGEVISEIEPLAANISGADHSLDHKKLKKEIVRIYAALLGVPFDNLWQREKRYRTRRYLTLAGIVFAAMAVFLAFMINKNALISAQNRELELRQSALLTDAAQMLLDRADIDGARQSAVSALNITDGLPYDVRAEKLLAEVNGAYTHNDLRKEMIYEQNSQIEDVLYTEDKGVLFICDQFGTVKCIDPDNGSQLWSCSTRDEQEQTFSSSYETRMRISADEQKLYIFSKYNIKAVSTSDGSMIWDHPMEKLTSCWNMSEDTSLISILEGEFDEESEKGYEQYLKILSSEDGSELLRIPIDENDKDGSELLRAPIDENNEDGNWTAYIYNPEHLVSRGSFSADNRYFGLVFFQKDETENKARCRAWTVDLENGEIKLNRKWDINYTLPLEIQGVYVNDDGNKMLVSTYDTGRFGIETFMLRTDSEEENRIFNEWIPSYITLLELPGRSDMLPMLTSEHLAVTVIEDQMHVRNLDDASAHGRWQFDGKVIGLSWLDRESELLWAATDKGNIYNIQLQYDSDEYIGKIEMYSFDRGTMITAAWLADNGQMVFLEENSPGKVMMLRTVNDGNYIQILGKDEQGNQNPVILQSPSGEKLFLIDAKNEQPLTLYTYDARTLEQTGMAVFETMPWISNTDSAACFNEDSVIYGYRILHSDGTISYPEDMAEEYYDAFPNIVNNGRSTLLSDGRNVSVTFVYDRMSGEDLQPDSQYNMYLLGRCWINGIKNDIRLRIAGPDKYLIGENGLIIIYGQQVQVEEGRISDLGDGKAFLVWDVVNDTFVRMECAGEPLTVATGKYSPVFAAVYSDGSIQVYDAGKNQSIPVTDPSVSSSVQALTFFDHDKYLAVRTYTGGFEVYRTEDAEKVFSSDQMFPVEDAENLKGEAFELPDGRVMLIWKKYLLHYGNAVIIDPKTFDVTAEIPDVFMYNLTSDRIIVRRDGNVGSYPLYGRDDLLSAALDR